MEDQKAKTDIKELQVPHELGQLNYAIERLDKTVHAIGDRLACVSHCVTKTAEIEVTKEPQPLVEIAQSIKSNSACINKLNEKLNDIVTGLEI